MSEPKIDLVVVNAGAGYTGQPRVYQFTVLESCLACGGKSLQEYINLGKQPLANSFTDGSKTLPRFPLQVNVCTDCYHSQLSVAVDPELLFKSYLYVSGTTATLRRYFTDFVDKVEGDFGGRKGLHVLEIGSNDGSLLKVFRERGHNVLGVDPAENLVGGEAICGFWNEATAEAASIGGPPFDVIIAMNVLAHVSDPAEFLRLCKLVLAPGGRIYVQTSQAMMLLGGEFDTCYHEHVSYFTAKSMRTLAERVGLSVRDITHVPIHGTSMLAILDTNEIRPQLSTELAEDNLGYYAPGIYKRFRLKAESTRTIVRSHIHNCRSMGYKIVGYGAAAKGMTFLNYTGIELDFIVDDNPLKIGKRTPGGNIPVLGPAAIDNLAHQKGSEKVLWCVLAWNFFDEIVERIKSVRPNAKDMFLTCFPRITLR